MKRTALLYVEFSILITHSAVEVSSSNADELPGPIYSWYTLETHFVFE